MSEPVKCQRCRGCGQLADSDDREPWTDWTSLPLQSSAAVLMGLVKPIPCDGCGGTGYAETREGGEGSGKTASAACRDGSKPGSAELEPGCGPTTPVEPSLSTGDYELPTSLIDATSYVLVEHTRIDIARCRCGWGSYAGNLGESHARHVSKALFEAGVLRPAERGGR